MRRSRHNGAVIAAVLLLSGVSGCMGTKGTVCTDAAATCPIDDPDSRPIAFSSDRSGSYDLWLMGDDGSNPVQLTHEPDDEMMPTWSNDGERLAFAYGDFESTSDICVINADGTGLINLTNTRDVAESTPSWSPDGSEIAYLRWNGPQPQIHIMKSDGGERRMIADGDWPSWSPDGQRILFSAKRGFSPQSLWTIGRDGHDETLIARNEKDLTEPSWSPNGEDIAYIAANGDSRSGDPVEWNEDIFVMNAAGGPARQITALPGNDHWPTAWSPDGQKLAITSDGEQNVGEILVVDLATLETTNLTRHGAHDMFPAWRRTDLATQ